MTDKLITDILIILCLVIIVIQDMKQRSISWMLIPLLLAGFVYKVFENNLSIKSVLINMGFIAIQLLALTIYMSIKNKKPVNIINTYLGIGDVLFFVVLSAAFSPANFIAFYLVSMILTLIGMVIYNLFAKNRSMDIPLAGAMAAMLIILMLVPGMNFYDDGYLLSILNK